MYNGGESILDLLNVGFLVEIWPVHTTLELFSCMMCVVRASTGMAGVFKNYNGSGLAVEIYCKVVRNGTLVGIGIYGGRVSVIVHTIYCYWKIVYPIHHRKYYRRWMIYVGIILPWLVGTVVKMALALATTGIVKGRCRARAYLQTALAFKVCCSCGTYCIVYFIFCIL